eukprot:8524749-Lingulodinium_polyedra.AAC.1
MLPAPRQRPASAPSAPSPRPARAPPSPRQQRPASTPPAAFVELHRRGIAHCIEVYVIQRVV